MRTIMACLGTATICFTISATTGLASRGSRPNPGFKTIPVGTSVYFPAEDLLCDNESSTPRFDQTGIACSSYASPYTGAGFWITRKAVVVTRPPNDHLIQTIKR